MLHRGDSPHNTHHPAGNDPELDPNRPADPPTRAIEKPVMRHGKREGTDAPKPMPERTGNQTRAKQTASANENGTSSQRGSHGYYKIHQLQDTWTGLTWNSFPGSRCRRRQEPRPWIRRLVHPVNPLKRLLIYHIEPQASGERGNYRGRGRGGRAGGRGGVARAEGDRRSRTGIG
jgi:plasminogen activator inhibitor 1 RNA-binding protein